MISSILALAFAAISIPIASSALPASHYKSVCPNPKSGSPLFVGQGIPSVYVQGHIDVAKDIHWLSLAGQTGLVGYVLIGTSGIVTVVPYSNQKVFVDQIPNAANQYLALGRIPLTGDSLTRALKRSGHVLKDADHFEVHRCFATVWDGKYPPGS